ncbi:uncharacterized protein LOC131932586 [Physella acuta]|uniref:uncharacterized protein LOC131932586 n=1 Tax=Physella acuta TaxID=109671 RepID=UPI0027DD23BB|nr:uncharacterized protein LOC131932586 [Physella acuta]XP_059145497.1 uncharacterized protein LOC131932586 [Physella acuta]
MKMFTSGSEFPMLCLLTSLLPSLISGHGRMLDPPSRMSAWISGYQVPVNHLDNEMMCGGRTVQWQQNGGKCGICGDPWSGPRLYERPDGAMVQHNVITKVYVEGSTITVLVQILYSHLGWIEFRLCDIASTGGVEATQACLDQTLLTNQTGKTRFEIGGSTPGFYTYTVVLPRGVTCKHCMLQWKWNNGKDWNCDDTGCGIGYGPQEQFYACADITISPQNGFSDTTTKSSPTTRTSTTTTKPITTTRTITSTTKPTTTSSTVRIVSPTYFDKFNFFKNYTASTMSRLNYFPTASPKFDVRNFDFYNMISALPDVNNSYYNGNITKANEDTRNRVCAYCKMNGCLFDCSTRCPEICPRTYFTYKG